MIVKNRLAVVMAEKGIRTVSALHRMIQDKGLTMSRRTLDKFYSNESNRVDYETLSTLCYVLNCDISDLLYLEKEKLEFNELPKPQSIDFPMVSEPRQLPSGIDEPDLKIMMSMTTGSGKTASFIQRISRENRKGNTYVISSSNEPIYIGESSNLSNRIKQHFQQVEDVNVIYDDEWQRLKQNASEDDLKLMKQFEIKQG